MLGNFPPGSANDPRAPWNAEDVPDECECCGKEVHPDDLIEIYDFAVVEYVCTECTEQG